MTQAGHSSAENLFHRALELDAESRPKFLAEACGKDAELRRRVEELLRADQCGDDFLTPPSRNELSKAVRMETDALSEGQRIGAYRILRSIGNGGMGEVYLAERADEQFQQTVAVKVIRAGAETEEILRRFQQERQTLARLNHPFIARLLDGGTTEVSAPFIVMEYVEGAPLLEYCNQARLGLDQRLRLFRRVCGAVEHAHRTLVIHRDLKPSNILVTRDGTPKLLDFGIAKVLRSEENDDVEVTRTGRAVMTLEYASPEQVRCEPVTTATDVFSLAVTLYELLSGSHPFRREGRLRYEVELAICEEEPPPPSSTLREALPGPAGSDVGGDRRRSVRRLRRALLGDLDTIVLKGLKKDAAERYGSVERLSEDLGRYLEGLPITARRDTLRYRLSKLIRRQKLSIGLSMALVLLAVAAVANLVNQASNDRARVAEILRLADMKRLRDYIEEEARLYPADPKRAPDLEGWLVRASALGDRLAVHESTLAEQRLRATASSGAEDSWVFASKEEQWEHDTLATLVEELRDFCRKETGTIARVEDRLRWANSVYDLSIADYDQEWEEAIAAIADPEDCPKYEGLELTPQIGLIPLGRDPDSDLWEFAHLRSGEPPESQEGGDWTIGEQTGLVFVLIPGGTYEMGLDSPGEYDPATGTRTRKESKQVTVQSFFLSKYEMTQAQWMRVGRGVNPSAYDPDFKLYLTEEITLSHPVESISSSDADRRMLELGLELPPEEFWEYAARAGTETVWWAGNTPASLEGAANVLDLTAQRMRFPSAVGQEVYYDDGHALHAPVDRFRVNQLGLHNIIGNVNELCRLWSADEFRFQRRPAGSWEVEEIYIFRGGAFGTPLANSRPGLRYYVTPEFSSPMIGVRPMRRITAD